jgi:serine/threonine-protein kinase
LSDETIGVLLDGKLDQSAVREVARHIDGCDKCRAIVVEVARNVRSSSLLVDASLEAGTAGTETGEFERVRTLPGGSALGRYIVVAPIGAGAMGIVYVALDPDLGRRVALKLLRTDPATMTSESGRARLLREAQAIARLSHPNVVSIHDVGTAGDEVFLALELVDGETLTEWLRIAPRSWREVLGVFREAGEGLAAAHAAGLVHRDFKPDNVLVGRDGRARVTDFGLARTAADTLAAQDPSSSSRSVLAASITRTGTLVGTPAYMAPEQLARRPADARADVFSYCTSLYEALYGERPFGGSTLAELCGTIERSAVRPPPPRARVPGWLRRIVVQGLRADPRDRPQTMRALLGALDAGSSRARRRRVLFGAAAIVGVAGVGGAVSTLPARGRESRPVLASSSVPTPSLAKRADAASPVSSSAEALRLYESGVQGLREGDGSASDAFARACERDPSFAAAHLRFALVEFWNHPQDAREHLARAVEHQNGLMERDALLLAAAQGWMQTQPADPRAFARRMDEALARFPLDAEVAYFAATAHFEDGDRDGALRLLDRVLELDPGFSASYFFKEEELAYGGDVDGALASIRDCVAHASNPMTCLLEQDAIDTVLGNCKRLGETSEQLLARDPTYHPVYWYLALAAYSQQRPTEAVTELLRQEVARAPPSLRHGFELEAFGALDALAGRFDEVANRAWQLEQRVAADSNIRWHAEAASWRVRALAEAGQRREAARFAQEFLRREEAWPAEARGDDAAMARDPRPVLLLAERDGGLISPDAFEGLRQQWVDEWLEKAQPNCRPFVWLHGYAAVVETADDAQRALAAQSKYGPMPLYAPFTLGDAFIGKTYFLAGRPAEGLPFLRRAARSCLALASPFDHTTAHLTLGHALAALGERDEACAAYRVVVTRWGRAAPRSVSAERARSSARALGCSLPP